jgi:hypothetical protein
MGDELEYLVTVLYFLYLDIIEKEKKRCVGNRPVIVPPPNL